MLYRKLAIPDEFLVTKKGHTFGGELRIGDLNGDGRCDFLVYRCNHGAPKGAHVGGMKPTFMGAFDLDGKPLWQVGEGGDQGAAAYFSELVVRSVAPPPGGRPCPRRRRIPTGGR